MASKAYPSGDPLAAYPPSGDLKRGRGDGGETKTDDCKPAPAQRRRTDSAKPNPKKLSDACTAVNKLLGMSARPGSRGPGYIVELRVSAIGTVSPSELVCVGVLLGLVGEAGVKLHVGSTLDEPATDLIVEILRLGAVTSITATATQLATILEKSGRLSTVREVFLFGPYKAPLGEGSLPSCMNVYLYGDSDRPDGDRVFEMIMKAAPCAKELYIDCPILKGIRPATVTALGQGVTYIGMEGAPNNCMTAERLTAILALPKLQDLKFNPHRCAAPVHEFLAPSGWEKTADRNNYVTFSRRV